MIILKKLDYITFKIFLVRKMVGLTLTNLLVKQFLDGRRAGVDLG